MKPFHVFLILRHFIFAALILAVGACSFKKDPAKSQGQIIVISNTESTPKEISLEEVIAQEDEEKALAALSQKKIENINDVKTSEGSLIDIAIKFNKKNILNYLLILGHSPFLLSENSINKLSYSDELNKILSEAQTDRFMGILRDYPNKEETGEINRFKSRIISNRLGLVGCQNFVNLLMNIKYSYSEKDFPGFYYRILNILPVEEAIKTVLTETECSQVANRFSTNKISEWLSYEVLVQFRHNFQSTDFFDFISSLGNTGAISVNVVNNNSVSGNTIIKLNPLLLLMIKRSCFNNSEQFSKWLNLLKKYVDKNRNHYTLNYFLKEDLSPLDHEYCDNEITCESYYKNSSTLNLVFGLLFPSAATNSDLYSNTIVALTEEPLNKKSKKLKQQICASAKRPSQEFLESKEDQ